MRVALENGVDTIEHGAQPNEEILELFKERGAADICTISPAVPYTLFPLEDSHVPEIAKTNGKVVMDGIIACAKGCLNVVVTAAPVVAFVNPRSSVTSTSRKFTKACASSASLAR